MANPDQLNFFCPYIISLSLVCLGFVPLTAQSPATLLGKWSDPELPASEAYENTYNEVWGFALRNKEYAVIGSTMGTHIIDVSRPQDAKEVAFVGGTAFGSNIIHRDYHHFGCYLYAVSDEGQGSLQIIDISPLPDSVRIVYDSDAFFSRSHNIFIDTSQAVLYACFARGGGAESASPLKLLDISKPEAPKELATYDNFGSGRVSHVHDCYVENGKAFLNLGFDGMAIVDFSDPLQPVYQNTLTEYPFAGYNHSGWPSRDLDYYFLGDESHGFPLKVLGVSDPSEIKVLYTFNADSPSSLSIPHNQIVACNYLYVSYYYDGLQIYDISQPDQPERVSFFNTSSRSHRKSYEGTWGVYPFLPSGNILVSDMQEGLFVVSGPDDLCEDNMAQTLNCEVSKPVAVIDKVSFPGKIYPQPARNYIQLEFEDQKSQEKVNVRLLDIHGCHLQRWEEKINGGQLELFLSNSLTNGMYLLQIQQGSQFFTKKILIHR